MQTNPAVRKDILKSKVMGHRGAALLAPENTLASIKAAAETGVKWVEIDVYLIDKGGLIIFHDDTLERCTNGAGVTRETDPLVASTLDAGAWFAPEFKGESIPTLIEALDCIQALGLGLNLEIKHDTADVENIVPTVLDTLKEYWVDNEKLLISSFNHDALKMVFELDPQRHLGQLYEAIPANWQAQLEQIHAYSLNCDYSLLTQAQAQAVKAEGYKLLCYTANDPETVTEHWEWGMDAVITDNPSVFASFI
ncbi:MULTISPECIES: glycerophosphoryl diester phosphodiesterase [Marinomonas]|uniref:Glycerophosphoryl diester phosphodiesterase n=1 Tax=Marinomonas arenicola TaxID=569601 RepID=A0ABU9G6A1_9GAMM